MPDINAEDYFGSIDDFLGKITEARAASRGELEKVRTDLVEQAKADAAAGAEAMGTIKVGGASILIPNSENLRALNLSSERVRERMSSFRLSYLRRDQVQELGNLNSTPQDVELFIRHSRRLARHAREFLAALQELEPTLEDEIRETLAQLEDNDMDLLKLEIKSYTRLRETLLRGAQARQDRDTVLREVETFDINRALWNLSLLEHPRAVVAGLLANASEAMASRSTSSAEELPKRAMVLVAPQPDAVERMTPDSRTANISWRLFSAEELDKRYEELNTQRTTSPSSWRNLGIGYGTAEWYMPVPPEITEGVRPVARQRRRELLDELRKRNPL